MQVGSQDRQGGALPLLEQPASLVGRDAELARLVAAVKSALASGGAVAVVGEAGIGKSTVVARVVGSFTEAQVVIARADELGARNAYGVVQGLIGPLPVTAGDTAADVEAAVVSAAAAAFEHWSARGPVVAVVEDLHWADAPSVRVLTALVRRLRDQPVALVLTARPAPSGPEITRLFDRIAVGGGEIVRLEPLPPADVVAIAERTLGAVVGPTLRARLGEVAGNPLYLHELLAVLAGADVLERGDLAIDVDAGIRTPSLSVTILQHLRGLSPSTLDILALGSVLGSSFDLADVAALAGRGVGELAGSIRESIEAGAIVEADGRLRFRHDLLRDALYDDQPEVVRRDLHLAAANVLATRGAPAGRVAAHLLRAGADATTVPMLVDTARAVMLTDPGVAAELLGHVLAITSPSIDARRGVLADYALALLWAGRLDDGEAPAREALALGLKPSVGAHLDLTLAITLGDQGRTGESRELALAALEHGAHDPPTRAHLEAIVGWANLMARDVAGAEEVAARATTAAEETGTVVGLTLALATRAMCARVRGSYEEAVELAEHGDRVRIRNPLVGAFRLNPRTVVAAVLLDVDRLDDALRIVDDDIAAALEIGSDANLAFMQFARAITNFTAGRWDAAWDDAERGLRLSEEIGTRHRLTGWGVSALVALGRGDLATALARIEAGEAEFAATGSPHHYTLVRVARARWHEAKGEVDEALAILQEMRDLIVGFEVWGEAPFVLPELLRLAAVAGRLSDVADVPGLLAQLVDRNPGVERLRHLRDFASALVGNDVSGLAAAVDGLRRGPRLPEIAAAEAEAGLVAAAAGEQATARDLVVAAIERHRTIGAPADAARLEGRAREAGIALGRRGRRARPATGWDALTEVELSVVRLVAERLTNPEIAERMFISKRTVQTHVSHALAKLGVHTRGELAAAAARHAGWRFGVQEGGQDPEQR